jgi:hypothetical protein
MPTGRERRRDWAKEMGWAWCERNREKREMRLV